VIAFRHLGAVQVHPGLTSWGILSRPRSTSSGQALRDWSHTPRWLICFSAIAAQIGRTVPHLRRSDDVAESVPALPGWAEVWLPALRAWVRFAVYFRVPTQTLPGWVILSHPRSTSSGQALRDWLHTPRWLICFSAIAVQIGRTKKGCLAWDGLRPVVSCFPSCQNCSIKRTHWAHSVYTATSGLRRRLRGARKCCE
jgi:hypothetical protein